MEARASVSGLAEATGVDGVSGRQKAEAGTASRATAWRRESSRAWSFGGFLKTGHLPGFHGPSKTVDQIFIKMAASWRILRSEERTSAVRWDRVQGDAADQLV